MKNVLESGEIVIYALALVMLAVLMSIMTTGCGHNAVVYSDGIGLDASINPENYTLGINFRYGKILTAAVKEKTKINMKAGMTQESKTGTSETNTGTITTGLDSELTFETGDQVTGYVVELEKVKNANSTASSSEADSDSSDSTSETPETKTE